jgi:hypothetical protein
LNVKKIDEVFSSNVKEEQPNISFGLPWYNGGGRYGTISIKRFYF